MNQLATDSLLWIKGELDGLLLRARQRLEAYVEAPDDHDSLGQCVESLHQIQGTLRIVEVYGAALLAEEMEAVAKSIYDGSLEPDDASFEALMRSILQLPDYLEHVVQGQRDIPLALLPLINDLRDVRGEPLLTESALFAHTVDGSGVRLPTLPSASATEIPDLCALSKKLRPKFQSALLKWLKDDSATPALERMAAIVGEFEQVAGRPAVFELWWIVGGVLEALADGGLPPSVELKQILGRIDQQIKRLARESEEQFANEPPRELINNLLYYVGRATSSGERVAGIKQSFDLGELLPDAARVDATRAALSGPNAQLMRTVSAAIKEDVVQVKDSLDIFVRTGRRNADELEPLAELLKKVGDTLAVLGLGSLRAGLATQVETLQAMANGQTSAEESTLMRIAESLIELETRLDSDMADLIAGSGEHLPDSTPRTNGETDNEYKNTFGAVIRESIVNLARVKEAMTEYSRDGGSIDVAAGVPGHIRQVQAGLGLVDMQRPAEVLESIRRYVEQRVLASDARPSHESLERMADALVSVEFYLETVQSGRGDPQSMLDNAETCVAELGVGSVRGTPSLSLVETRADEHSADAAAGPAESGLAAPEAEAAPRSGSDFAKVEAPPPPVEPAAEKAAGPLPEEVDPEILEIFLEEAHEELARLGDYFPRWQRNLEDREALTVVRRSFHTLKGSGRMVGARRIGEFAWAVENMLNRVIDGTVEAGEPVVELVGEVLAALPELVEELEVGRPPEIDVDGLIRRADAFSRNEAPEATPAAEAEAEAGTASVGTAESTGAEAVGETADEPPAAETETASQEAMPAPAMDPALYDIFSREIAGHLEIVEAFLAEYEISGISQIDEPLLRALHTLKGSAHTAGVDAVSELVEPAETYVKAVAEHHELMQPAAAVTLREMIGAIESIVADLADAHAGNRDFTQLKQKLARLAEESAIERPAEPESKADEPDINAIADEIEEFVAARAAVAGRAEAEAPAEDMPVGSPEADSMAPDDAVVPAEPLEPAVVSPAPADAPPTAASADFDPELAAIFFEEARELLESIDVAMQGWSENQQDDAVVAELQRHLHTFKGGARMAGLMPLGDLSHELETLLTHVADGRLRVSDRLLRVVQQVVDRLHQMLESSIAGAAPQPAGDLLDKLAWLRERDRGEDEEYEATQATEPVESAVEPEPASEDQEVVHFRPPPESERRGGSRIQQEVMRVRADLLENALNHAGEVGIYRSRLEQHNSTMNFNIAEFDVTVARLREQLRKFEIETEAQIVFQHEQESGDERGDFDPLELDRYSQLQQLSRSLMESVGDLVSIQALLANQARETETLLLQQSRVTTELQDSLMRTRMVPFSNQAQRLRRVVRQAVRDTGKHAELKLTGAEGEMDRQVLERVLAPLEHMLRNSVVHGIESPQQREKLNKQHTGQITIGLHREGAEVVIDIIDDGAGLDIDAIRAQAIARGLLDPDVDLPENNIMQFIFETGFSTAETITKSAGRGVGMDVVANEVKQLGGAVMIDSVAGAGTKITVRLPFTLAITQALMVTVGDEPFAIPLPTIEGIARIPGRDLNRFFAGELKEFTYGGRAYRLHHLSSLLDCPVPEAEGGRVTYPVLLVHSGDDYGALVTESMRGSREIVVKSIGPQLASIRGLSGATILGDGSILLILDPAALVRGSHGRMLETTIIEQPMAAVDNRKLVMVVDDSITVRRVTQRLLERYDMRVETAKDGVDALTRLQDLRPDVMLLDIEMPRMDGYELAANIRNDKRLRNVPIIMITSRTGEKHRNRAMDIGVNEYLGKPYQESELLEHIQRLIEPAGTAA